MANQTITQDNHTIVTLTHRVHHVLRRANRNTSEYRFKDLHIDLRAHRVWRDDREVELTPREYAQHCPYPGAASVRRLGL